MWIPAGAHSCGHVDSVAGATGPLFSLLPPENATGNYVKIVQRVPVKKLFLIPEKTRITSFAGHERRARRIHPMSTAATLTADQDLWRPKFNPWLIAVVVAMAAFMEVLDTSIANVALPYIGGNLGASNDQSTWVLTSYLVSNAIVLPISGWMAGALGRKRFFSICLFIFTTSSLLCGIAPSLGLLLFFRVLQGAGGGGLQPMAQAILADIFHAAARPGICALRHHGGYGAHNWSDAGRVDHVQLFLALDFLHQSAGRHPDVISGLSIRRRSAVPGAHQGRRREARLYRDRFAGFGRVSAKSVAGTSDIDDDWFGVYDSSPR